MSIKAKPKKRGRPATGRDPMMGFRAAPVLRASIVKWAENQPISLRFRKQLDAWSNSG
jgi:hypothetical protein